MSKFAPLIGFALTLFISSAQAAPPYYFGKQVTVISKDSIYYGCQGTVEAWADSEVVVKDLCYEYKTANFKDSELKLNGKNKRTEQF